MSGQQFYLAMWVVAGVAYLLTGSTEFAVAMWALIILGKLERIEERSSR